MRKNIFLCLLALIFCACVPKTLPTNTKAVRLLIISPVVRINDSGFIHEKGLNLLVQIYSAGTSVLELKIGSQICINGTCEDEQSFNQKFFGKSYYNGILKDIINAKKLFNASFTPNSCGGFSQSFSGISYEVCQNKVSFKNEKTKIEFFYE